jgi:hypothetical protein
MQTGYNGWSCEIEGDHSNFVDLIEEELPEITADCYDDDGYCEGDPEDFEDDVKEAVSNIVNQEHILTFEYDNFSS